MQVGKVYNTQRYGLVVIKSMEPKGFHGGVPYFKVHMVILDHGRETDGTYTERDWKRACKPL
jgi:hypothetical protein